MFTISVACRHITEDRCGNMDFTLLDNSPSDKNPRKENGARQRDVLDRHYTRPLSRQFVGVCGNLKLLH